MQLNPLAFNAFLNDLGQTFAWLRAYACPCLNPNSGAAKPDCPLCAGKGQTWGEAVEGISGIAGQSIQLKWAKFGLFEPGDVVLTIPSDSALYEMGQFDRVVMLNSSAPFSTKFVRGRGDVLRYPNAQVDRVFWLNGSDIVEGGIPTVADDGTLTWTTGEPPAGTVYSITGRCHPEYFCWGPMPQDRAHHGGKALPRKVVLRAWDLFGR
jgi:hypothetical protein